MVVHAFSLALAIRGVRAILLRACTVLYTVVLNRIEIDLINILICAPLRLNPSGEYYRVHCTVQCTCTLLSS